MKKSDLLTFMFVICVLSITATETQLCDGGETELTAEGAIGMVHWFEGSCDDSGEIGTGNPITVSPSSTTTYYARNHDDGQFSAGCAQITITVKPLLRYRSKQSGNWVTLANREQYNGTDWGIATSYPGQISNDCPDPLVTIQPGHEMGIQNGITITIPNLNIEGTGKLTIKHGGKFNVQDQLQLDESTGPAIVVESTPLRYVLVGADLQFVPSWT